MNSKIVAAADSQILKKLLPLAMINVISNTKI